MEIEEQIQDNAVGSADGTTKIEPVSRLLEETPAAAPSKKWLKLTLIGSGIAVVVAAVLVFFLCFYPKPVDPFKPDMELIPVYDGEKWGYVNAEGRYIIQPQFEMAEFFCNNLAKVEDSEGKVGYIDKTGVYVIPAKYVQGTNFSENVAFVVEAGCAPICIDMLGTKLFELNGVVEVANYWGGLARIGVTGDDGIARYGFVDKTGKIVVKPQFAEADCFVEELALVCNDKGKWGFINPEGKYVIEPKFESAASFSEGMAAVCINNRWGFINKKGKYVVEPQFEKVMDFYNGCAGVQQGAKWGLIDKKGKFVVKPQFDFVCGFVFDEDLCMVQDKDKMGFINKKGKYAIEPRFDEATWFVDGLALVRNNGRFGIINKKGEFVGEMQFDMVNVPINEATSVRNEGYDCSAFFRAFFKDFDIKHVAGLKRDAMLGDIDSTYGKMNVYDFGWNNVDLKPQMQLTSDIALQTVSFGFSDDTYTRTSNSYSVVRTVNDSASLVQISYDFELSGSAYGKSNLVVNAIAKRLATLYRGTVSQGADAVIVDGSGFDFIVVDGWETIQLYVFFDEALFKEACAGLGKS